MTSTSKTSGFLAGGLLAAFVSGIASVLIAAPVANADPQQCNTTVGQTSAETVQSYLDQHPDVKAQLTARANGSGTDLIDYLNRHPDVRQALITLANQCTS